MSTNINTTPVISLSEGFGALVVQGQNIKVEVFDDGRVVVHSGTVENLSSAVKLATSCAPAALKVGDVVQGGPGKGWLYCETRRGEAFLVASKDAGVMKWREAMEYAAREKFELPNYEQLKAIHDARKAGLLRSKFNTGEYSAGWYWSATQYDSYNVRCLRMADGFQGIDCKDLVSSVRFVRRYSIN